MKNKNLILIFIILIIFAALPAIIGFFTAGSKYIYSGVVFNPIDGYTYLAKMQIGMSGDWFFTLPYSAQPGEGRLLYPFYITAGQIFQKINIPVAVSFNLLRLAAFGILIYILARLATVLFDGKSIPIGAAFLLLSVGGGLGWVLLPFGKFGADFWVAEAFPFLSGLANPHFPLALGLMVFSLLFSRLPENGWRL
ncbi:MAG TPA: hypothetical protein VF338_10610, partial [Leptolinea sp.]